MKPIFALAIGLFSLVVSLTSRAGSLGTLVLGGTGCTAETGESELIPAPGYRNRYKVPLQIAITKRADVSLVRQSCNFRLPVEVGANEKVVVSNVAQWVRLGASANTQVKTNLEIFLTGSRGNPLTTEVKALDKPARLFQTVRSEGIVAESECGKSAIVAGNLSANAIGASQATAALGMLLLDVKIVKCN